MRALLHDRKWRAVGLQVLLLAALAVALFIMTGNAVENLRRQNIASGFGFLQRTAGFDISQALIDYKNTDTYIRAFWVGLLNTLVVAAVGIVLATVLGFVIGIARLSTNWLVAKLALVYVEIVRNVPLLLWLLAMYFGVLLKLPGPGSSVGLPLGALLNQRGLYFPLPLMTALWTAVAALAVVGALTAAVLYRARSSATAHDPTTHAAHSDDWPLWLLPMVPAVVVAVTALPLTFVSPVMGRYNLEGGGVILPELMALLIGLVTYTAAYIAEIVRGGILSVPRGQTQAAAALGLSGRDTLRLVVVPQALRAIVPPLTNQYVNLAKNSSLAVAVGYPDLVSVFAGTILNHTNQAVETIAITMLVYLTLSLAISAAMNAVNARVALKER
jgi:general L-amino acid transport system permease protein